MMREELAAALAEAQVRLDAATGTPWFASDCEGELVIWREAVLRNVRRNEAGEITGWRTPGSYATEDQILERDLGTWDSGESLQDDRIRATAALIVFAVNQQQRAIDHGLDVLKRHADYGDGTCTGCHPLGTRSAADCPEIAGQHRVWRPAGAS